MSKEESHQSKSEKQRKSDKKQLQKRKSINKNKLKKILKDFVLEKQKKEKGETKGTL